MRIFDAKDCIVGRVAVKAAKAALMGEEVAVVNCDTAVLSGMRLAILKDALHKLHLGSNPNKGPFFQRNSDRYFRRIITRMLPRTTARGREAVTRVLCYTGVPKVFEGKKLEKVPGSDKSKLPHYNYVTVKELCKQLGGKK